MRAPPAALETPLLRFLQLPQPNIKFEPITEKPNAVYIYINGLNFLKRQNKLSTLPPSWEYEGKRERLNRNSFPTCCLIKFTHQKQPNCTKLSAMQWCAAVVYDMMWHRTFQSSVFCEPIKWCIGSQMCHILNDTQTQM